MGSSAAGGGGGGASLSPITRFFVMDDGTDKLYQRDPGTGEDLLTSTPNTVSTGFTSRQYRGLHFKPDGLRFYVGGSGTKKVHEYSLSTAWDPSSTRTEEASFAATHPTPQFLTFTLSLDGDKLYIGDADGKLYQYSLSTPWDIMSASYDSVSLTPGSRPDGVAFSHDGMKVFITSVVSSGFRRHSLTTAWDISTAGAEDQYYDVFDDTGQVPNAITWNQDGTMLYGLEQGDNEELQFSLTSGYDLTTITYDGATAGPGSKPYGITTDMYRE